MDAIFLQGTMWAGKTYQLVQAAKKAMEKGLKIEVFEHPENTRGSDRDLSSLLPNVKKFDQNSSFFSTKNDLIIFDEIHFYECFNTINEILCVLEEIKRHSPACTIIFGGLLYDFYSNLRQFRIWDYLSTRFDRVEKRLLFTTNPCCSCGRWVGVNYTVNIDAQKGRVGDHYDNACFVFEKYSLAMLQK